MINKQKASVEDLYKAYQEHRDDISASVLFNVKEGIQEAAYESNIHTILQQAKIARNVTEETKYVKKSSLWSKAQSWLTNSGEKAQSFWQSGPVMSGFAVLALAVICAPIVMNLQNGNHQQFAESSHLSECYDCLSLVSASSVTTRSNNFQFNAKADHVLAARLGRLIANFKIINASNDTVDLNTLKSLQKEMTLLAAKTDVELLIHQSTNSSFDKSDIESVRQSIQKHLETNELISVFNSAQQLQITLITTQYATTKNGASDVDSVFNRALKSLSDIPELTPASNSALNDMKDLSTSINWGYISKDNLNEIATAAKVGLDSLGL